MTLVMAETAIITVQIKCSIEDLFVTKKKRSNPYTGLGRP